MSDEQTCPDCGGRTIEFRGRGDDTEYRICPRYKEPGHLALTECAQRLAERRQQLRPSGRFA